MANDANFLPGTYSLCLASVLQHDIVYVASKCIFKTSQLDVDVI